MQFFPDEVGIQNELPMLDGFGGVTLTILVLKKVSEAKRAATY